MITHLAQAIDGSSTAGADPPPNLGPVWEGLHPPRDVRGRDPPPAPEKPPPSDAGRDEPQEVDDSERGRGGLQGELESGEQGEEPNRWDAGQAAGPQVVVGDQQEAILQDVPEDVRRAPGSGRAAVVPGDRGL